MKQVRKGKSKKDYKIE